MKFTDCYNRGGVAQLGEHLPCKQGVRSSTLLISTTSLSRILGWSHLSDAARLCIRGNVHGLIAQPVRAHA